MFDKVYLKDYILDYPKVKCILSKLLNNYSGKITCNVIGTTNFLYDIASYKIGCGDKFVLLVGATHSNEIVTTYFLLDFMIDLLKNYDSMLEYMLEYTFLFIPILNVDGYIITSSNVVKNFFDFSKGEIEGLSKKYLKVYNEDDKIAAYKKEPKAFYSVLNASVKNIDDICLRNSVINILKKCNLKENVLNIWSANGLGIDQNSNSIHRFNEIKKLRKMQKFANLRYNDIPVTIPSPMSYPGKFTFDRSPENKALYDYIIRLYSKNNLKYIFSFHSTGGEVYGMPSSCFNNECKMLRYFEAIKKYCEITGYKKMDDKFKYGVMDYYREVLNNVLCLTIELSLLNANPIGPFSDILSLENEVVKNKNAILKLISM